MNPYRTNDGELRGVCIVCYRYGTRTESECPHCHVAMTSFGTDLTSAEVVNGLRHRAQLRLARPGRRRMLLAFGGGILLALVTTGVLLSAEVFEPTRGNHDGVDTSLMWSILTGSFLGFAGVLYLIGLKLFPRAPALPSPPTASALAEYLGIVLVDQ